MREARRVFEVGMGSSSANIWVREGDGKQIAMTSSPKKTSDEHATGLQNERKRRRLERGHDEESGTDRSEAEPTRCHWELSLDAVVAAVKSLEVREAVWVIVIGRFCLDMLKYVG